ncbi:hypothetical protein [Aeoliella sp.]|uniref:hypothetical protein n=1 Tax=Aeoliella sp. TaxID=2795800 RepID=UPI003CCC2B13
MNLAMELRPELTPIELDESLVARLAKLASAIDGAAAGEWEEKLAEFNRLAGTSIAFEELQGIYGGEEHEDYVRRLLWCQKLHSDPELTVAEMTEIVERVIDCREACDFYMEVFLANCKHPSGSDLIYWPDLVPELPQDREPTSAEIAELAMRSMD